jgi:thiol-disulfide isomerase/thioredoxin
LRRPLQSALITGSAIWLVGSIALSVRPDTGQELPTLSFASLEGPMVSLAQFKGQPTVVNLWATWCPPCVHEMPVLQQAQTDYPDVNFVFVNQRESPDKVDAWLRARRLTLRNMLLDTDGQTAAAFKQRALPMTLFFNQRGRLVSARIGELSSATLTERLDGLRSE